MFVNNILAFSPALHPAWSPIDTNSGLPGHLSPCMFTSYRSCTCVHPGSFHVERGTWGECCSQALLWSGQGKSALTQDPRRGVGGGGIRDTCHQGSVTLSVVGMD